MSCRLLILLTAPFLFACQNGFKVMPTSFDQTNAQCSTPNVKPNFKAENQLQAPNIKAENQFQKISDQASHDLFSGQKLLLQKSADAILRKDEEYVATMNRNCLHNAKGKLNSGFLRLKNGDQAALARGSDEVSALVQLNDPLTPRELDIVLENENCILNLSQNIAMKTLAVPNDDLLKDQPNLTAIGFQDSYDFYQENFNVNPNNTVLVAIIDNGLNLEHPDLKPNLWTNTKELNGTAGVDDDNNGYVDDVYGYDFAEDTADPSHKGASAHGSHVAGLAAAASNNTVGISGVITKGAQLMALNVFGEQDETNTVVVDEAIRYAADNGAHVINMSLGGAGRSDSTAQAIQYAISKGAVVVVAAGNEAKEISLNNFFSPAGYAKDLAGMISVGASDAANPKVLCDFSNRSSTYVEIAAPGCDSLNPTGLLSTITGSNYLRIRGTSMASPQVAGAAALAMLTVKNRKNAAVLPGQIEDMLVQSGQFENTLTNLIKGSKHLNINLLANFIQTEFPTDAKINLECHVP